MKRIPSPCLLAWCLLLSGLVPFQSKLTASQTSAASPGQGDATRPPSRSSADDHAADGDGSVTVSGELKQWHKATLTQKGPFAREGDQDPNPFLDYRMTVSFTHESGTPAYRVPGYFAADGRAGESSATAGNRWRAHLSPDKPGRWDYRVSFVKGEGVAVTPGNTGTALHPCDGQNGSFMVAPTDKQGRDFRAHGRLAYVGRHHLQFRQSGQYFLKAGPDAPETLLAYVDFDGTTTRKTKLKTWQPHVRDWNAGDPTWKEGKGKGLIGALNYLAAKGLNAFSFLTYNAGGDGRNVWPMVDPDAPLHYDCSKLDQWQVVFDHAQALGLYLHFKMQEQENDDRRTGHERKTGRVPAALDGGELGPERRLYCRELIARFGHALALNWNLGEENTQSAEEQRAMARYLKETDPYDHHIVVHTFPDRQDEVYNRLLGDKSVLTGASLQNHWNKTHPRTLQWVLASARTGKPWVVANDEQGPANLGVPPDPGYQGFNGKDNKGNLIHSLHDIRKATLWGNLMAGGAGVEYYFGYQLPENDLLCEDFRSRDQTWDYCRIALGFFREHLPFWQMTNANDLVGNPKNDNRRYCLAKPGRLYVVYLPQGGSCRLNLEGVPGVFSVQWFNPRTGGALAPGSVRQIEGGQTSGIGSPPRTPGQDWVAVLRRQ